MRIVVTGASGFIGRQIVPMLRAEAEEVLVVGRDPAALAGLAVDGTAVCGYDDLASAAAGFDALIHLAVRNNDQPGNLEDFRAANVALLQRVLTAARTAGISVFINTSSLKIDAGNEHPYTISKAEGEAALAEASSGLRIVNLRLAAVYGNGFKGALSVLNRVPSLLRPLALNVLSCIKPVTHVERIAEAILHHARSGDRAPGLLNVFVTDRQMDNGVYQWTMRFVDLVFAVTILVGFWWLLLMVFVAVRATSPGPAIFKQDRVGRGGTLFTCYKFRTMRQGTRQAGTHEVDGSSVTKVGAFLRRTKIDEFPQIANIFRNEISLVGPRPCLPTQEVLVAERRRRGVLDIKGGITGYSQIRNVDMSDPVRLAVLDAEYVARRTVLLDLSIIVATIIGRGQGDKVKPGPEP